MKRLIALLAIAAAAASVQAEDVKDVMEQAMKGDYQAQRNLAYGYASRAYPGQQKSALQACSWYLLILRSDSPKLTAGDIGNVKTYCEPLDFDARLSAERKANTLYRSIYGQKS